MSRKKQDQQECYNVRFDGMGWGTEDGTVTATAVFFFRMVGLDSTPGPALRLCTSMQEVERTRDQCDVILQEYATWQRRN